MNLINRSRTAGTILATFALTVTATLAGNPAAADTIFTVNGVDVDSTVVDLYFENRLGRPDATGTPQEREVLMSELKDIYLLSTQDFVEELAQEPTAAAQLELQKRGILAQLAAASFLDSATATEEELLAEYAVQIELAPPLQFKASHILVETQGEATDLITQLDEGADFAELAKEKSTGPSGPNGGDLGWFSPNQMVAPFTTAVEALEDGAYTSQPVQTEFGWHVILRAASRETEPPTFESVRENIVKVVEQRKFQDFLETLRSAAAE
jgi:peptidyl-prolyl cis-trans isomerase C